VVVVAFQNTFRSEKCANNIFLFFKNYFWDLHIKIIWKYQKHIILKQKKKLKFFQKHFWKALPNMSKFVPTLIEVRLNLFFCKKFSKNYFKIIFFIILMCWN
jgi:hypothetical protein